MITKFLQDRDPRWSMFGAEDEFTQFDMSLTHPSEDIGQEASYTSLELEREAWAVDIYLGIVSIQIII